jgi:hypothetical protein
MLGSANDCCLRKGITPAPNSEPIMTIAVTGIATAQKTHCPLFMSRTSFTFIPKMLETVDIGRNMMVTIVKT